MTLTKTNSYIIDHEERFIYVFSMNGLNDFAFSTNPNAIKKSLEECKIKRVMVANPVILTPEFKREVQKIENCLGVEPIEVLVIRAGVQVKETVFIIGE